MFCTRLGAWWTVRRTFQVDMAKHTLQAAVVRGCTVLLHKLECRDEPNPWQTLQVVATGVGNATQQRQPPSRTDVRSTQYVPRQDTRLHKHPRREVGHRAQRCGVASTTEPNGWDLLGLVSFAVCTSFPLALNLQGDSLGCGRHGTRVADT